MTECKKECEIENYSACLENHPVTHYGCTRVQGHSGSHVACGVEEHDLYVWEGVKNV